MKKLMAQVQEFHEVFGHPILITPTLAPENRAKLRIELIREELQEFIEAIEEGDIVKVADSLGDLAYVVAGAGHEFGIPLDLVVEEIHRSNMSKLGADGKPIYRDDGKSLKGPNYTPPDIASILALK